MAGPFWTGDYFDGAYWPEGYFGPEQETNPGAMSATLSGSGGLTATASAVADITATLAGAATVTAALAAASSGIGVHLVTEDGTHFVTETGDHLIVSREDIAQPAPAPAPPPFVANRPVAGRRARRPRADAVPIPAYMSARLAGAGRCEAGVSAVAQAGAHLAGGALVGADLAATAVVSATIEAGGRLEATGRVKLGDRAIAADNAFWMLAA